MKRFLFGTIATALTFAIVAAVLPKIDFGGDLKNLVVVSVLFGLVNGLIRPIAKVLSLPLTILTLGMAGIIINAALLLLVAWLSDAVGIDFTIAGFPPEFGIDTVVWAVAGAVAISIVGSVVGMVVKD